MGSVALPVSGLIGVDANVVIYAVEKHPQLRARLSQLRSPEAIHAATAQLHHVSGFVTNDVGFRAIPGFNVVILSDVVATNP